MTVPTIHFDKAPIVEAVIGIDFEEILSPDALEGLSGLAKVFGATYPTVENIMMGEYKIQPGSPVSQVDFQVGYFFKSADGLQVIHAKRNGFAFSRLYPYQTWKDFITEAKLTWAHYRAAMGSASLSKFTVRYINRLSWPSGDQIEDYLAVYPHIPNGLPQEVNGCFLRLEYPLSEPYQGRLVQQIATVSEMRPDMVSFVLDNEFSFAAIGLQDFEVWQRIENCQDLKNQVFLGSITDKMKGLIS